MQKKMINKLCITAISCLMFGNVAMANITETAVQDSEARNKLEAIKINTKDLVDYSIPNLQKSVLELEGTMGSIYNSLNSGKVTFFNSMALKHQMFFLNMQEEYSWRKEKEINDWIKKFIKPNKGDDLESVHAAYSKFQSVAYSIIGRKKILATAYPDKKSIGSDEASKRAEKYRNDLIELTNKDILVHADNIIFAAATKRKKYLNLTEKEVATLKEGQELTNILLSQLLIETHAGNVQRALRDKKQILIERLNRKNSYSPLRPNTGFKHHLIGKYPKEWRDKYPKDDKKSKR